METTEIKIINSFLAFGSIRTKLSKKEKRLQEKKMQKYRPLEIKKEQSLIDNKMLVPSKLATIVVTSMDREKSC